MLKVLNVNASLSLKTGGGTAERTFQMSRFLALAGIDCTVLTIDTGLDQARLAALKPAKVVTVPMFWQRYYLPWTNWQTIERWVNEADIVHLMGHWSMLNALVYVALRRARKPYVVCPAGALPIFGRSKWLKRLYNLLVGNSLIRNAAGWIAVTAAEFPHFESYGIPAARITVIPNGISREDFPRVDINAFRRAKGLPYNPCILFMGRLNPIKGPDLLLQAFASVCDRIPDYHLVFAGPDEGMQPTLLDMARHAGVLDRVHFVGFVGGSDKSAAYRMASLLVVPSRQEAMSIVALEAGICGTPVLLTDQCGFGAIKTIDPALEVGANPSEIAAGLVRLLHQPDALKAIAAAFETYVAETYAWHFIAARFIHLYKDLLETSGGE